MPYVAEVPYAYATLDIADCRACCRSVSTLACTCRLPTDSVSWAAKINIIGYSQRSSLTVTCNEHQLLTHHSQPCILRSAGQPFWDTYRAFTVHRSASLLVRHSPPRALRIPRTVRRVHSTADRLGTPPAVTCAPLTVTGSQGAVAGC